MISQAAGATTNAHDDSVSIDLYIGGTQVGYALMETNTDLGYVNRHLLVCAFAFAATTVVAEVDPGSGVLEQYTNDSSDEDCFGVYLDSVRKFRAFIWRLAVTPSALGVGLSLNLTPGHGGIIGSATIGFPNGTPDIHVCAVPGYGTMNADIDPGSGRLVQYTATNGCTDTNPGNSRRKFRAWRWTLPPAL